MSRDNAAWVEELKSADDAALSDLRAALLRNLRAAMASRPRADEPFLEDAVQDAIVRVLERIDQFEGRSHFMTWATSIAIHVAFGELRLRRWRDVSLDEVIVNDDFTPDRAVEPEAPPDVQFERRAILDALQRAIDEDLTERQRTALVAELRGMPQSEIARQLGINRNALYKLTHDARKKLRAGLEAAGYSADDVFATAAK